MKILLITDNHAPTGGAEKQFFELKKQLQQLNYTVFSFGFAEKEQLGSDCYTLARTKNKFRQFISCLFVNKLIHKKLTTLLADFQPDVIHLHNFKQYSASLFKILAKYPSVQTVHDYSYICPVAYNIHQDLSACVRGFSWRCILKHRLKFSLPGYWANVLLFYLNRIRAQKYIKYFITPSPLLQNYLQMHLAIKTTYIPPFIEQWMADAVKNNVSQAQQDATFLFIGNFGKHKGIYLLLNEFCLALKKTNHIKLIMLGKGPEQSHIIRLISKKRLANHIQVCNWQADLSPYYQNACAIVFPSLCMESFGLVITEAMAYGKPVIGSNRGSIPWLIRDNENGLIFNPMQRGDLAAKIVHLAKSPQVAKQLGMQGKMWVNNFFHNDESLHKIIEIYQKIIKQ